MKLFLVQHAKAKNKNEDPTRPLSEKGWKDIKKIAKYAEEYLHIDIRQIFHSGKLRAEQTAEVLAKDLNPPEKVTIDKNLEPLGDPKAWKRQLIETTEDVMLVGHLPHLSKLASSLLFSNEDQKAIAFKMGGIVCLQRGQQHRWTIQWMITPEIIS
ncbi:MAG: phosphohistidine phosphatase SixA [Candidatus Bathyarchaeota archaeon]|nr:MAG: phosphohistidine phosphatase SixA [Candidatus Bathyarchaeota archaeon]